MIYCEIYEYPLKYKSFDISIMNISGSYTKYGCRVNKIFKEIIFIIEGCGNLYISNFEVSFEKGDVIFIDIREKYKWETNCKAAISSLSVWNKSSIV